MEEKALKRRYRIIYFIIILFLIIAIGRLFSLQIIDGSEYKIISDSRLSRDIPVKAPRGEILDRYGKPLVQNRIAYSISISATKSTAEINNVALNLIKLFDGIGLEYEKTLPVTELKPYEFTFVSDDNMTAEEKEAQFKKKANLSQDLTAEEVVNKYRDKYKFDKNLTDWEVRKLAGMRYEMEKRNFSANNPYLFAEDVSIEVITRIRECSDDFSCVTVYTQPVRQYTSGSLAAHILGRIGIISPEEYEELKEKGYGMNDYLGKQGIEKAFESYLRGTDGVDSIERRVGGSGSELVFSKEPIAGNTVMLTIDRDLQAATEKALEENIRRIAQTSTYGNGHDAVSGAAVVLDLNTGEILSIASYPTYDPEKFNADYERLSLDPNAPMLNRALMGTYEPGSTYKLVTALSALEEGIITPETTINTKGVYEYYGHDFMCSIYRASRGTHGIIDVSEALQHSCNYFFYEMGDKLGIEKLTEYSTILGLGDYTGIELEEEVKGQLAGPELREKHNKPWYPGDVLQAAIGQSDNLFTPIQMANYVSTIVNGGKNYKLHLLKAVKSNDNEKLLVTTAPEIRHEINIKEENLKAVLDGMKLVASEGTASAAFADFAIKTGGKTGSAQVARGSSNGIYVGFAPFDNPQIAVAIVVEHGGSGGNVSYIARDIFNQYFFGNREYTGEIVPDNTLLR
ncbi:MAG: penicillin-binding protein 2 [Ruminococcaceae bacterium]|nr:penicillin-binding protein 2 [Oscillospiraceae bacterium]